MILEKAFEEAHTKLLHLWSRNVQENLLFRLESTCLYPGKIEFSSQTITICGPPVASGLVPDVPWVVRHPAQDRTLHLRAG